MSPSVLRSTYEPVSSSRYVAEEILRTLDSFGTLESLPFMPEMLQYCGRRFRVYKRADKTCDTIDWGLLRRMENASHLEELRCDGAAHGGCQAGCLLFWKDAWLKRVDERAPNTITEPQVPQPSPQSSGDANTCTVPALSRAARRVSDDGEEIFVVSGNGTETGNHITSPMVGADAVHPRCPIAERNRR